MKRPKRATIPNGSVPDMATYWTDRDDPAPGDGWVNCDGGWSSVRGSDCHANCECSIEARKLIDDMNRPVRDEDDPARDLGIVP